MIVYLDANICIYQAESHPVFGPRVEARLNHFAAAGDSTVTGDISRTECYVGPYLRNNAQVEGAYDIFFATTVAAVLPVTPAVALRAARIRADYNFELGDALNLATAVEHGCGVFLTADRRLAACTGIPVEILR